MSVSPDPILQADLRLKAEALAAALPPLLVAAERIAATVAQGVHGRRRVGAGDAFWQFRRYHAGDSLHQVDWRQSGKSQALFVRQNEWTAAESVWLWADASASMEFHSRFADVTKRARAELLALALAVLLVRGGERVAMLDAGHRPATGRAVLSRLADHLARRETQDRGHPSLPLQSDLPRFSQLVLMGDFLSPPEALTAWVGRLAGRGVNGLLLQILDPAEEEFPYAGRTYFYGPENEGDFLVGHAASLRDAYHARLAARRAMLQDLCRRHGWHFLTHRTDRPAQSALLSLYAAISGKFAV